MTQKADNNVIVNDDDNDRIIINDDTNNNDTIIDMILDYIKENKLNPYMDWICSYIIALIGIHYYIYSYLIQKPCIFHMRKRFQYQYPEIHIPLMTHVRTSLHLPNNSYKNKKNSDIYNERLNELVSLLKQFHNEFLYIINHNNITVHNTGNDNIKESSSKEDIYTYHEQYWIQLIRDNVKIRRIVSQFMKLYVTTILYNENDNEPLEVINVDNINEKIKVIVMLKQLFQRLQLIWIDLLQLPTLYNTTTTSSYRYKISLIISVYKESPINVQNVLLYAKKHAYNPNIIQVVIVHVNNTCPDLLDHIIEINNNNNNTTTKDVDTTATFTSTTIYDPVNNDNNDQQQYEWGELKIVNYNNDNGRGPAYNYGATKASGQILSFLHADTLLPYHWDNKVINVFESNHNNIIEQNDNNDNNNDSQKSKKIIYHACTFRYSINTTTSGLDGRIYPRGISSVKLLGRLRASICRLPYGDHVISIPSTYFHYLGGYPNQSMMEDYDFIDLLRQRSSSILPLEQLYIIHDGTVLCSPRRWQTLGVTYVTSVNALLVYRYAKGYILPNDVFHYYYKRPFLIAEASKKKKKKGEYDVPRRKVA